MQTCKALAIISFSAALVSGCSSDAIVTVDPTKTLVGCWEGNDYQPVLGASAKWLIQRRADGTFDIEFTAAGKTPQRESGRWRVEGRTYTTTTLAIGSESVDIKDPQFTDVYQLKDLSPNAMTYFHVKMNLTFQSIKVACPSDA
jgi:hypothetical protein